MKVSSYFSAFVLFLFFNLGSATAQIGIKGGIGVSDIAFLKNGQTPYLGHEVNSLEHRKPRSTFHVGVFGAFPLSKSVELRPEFLFSLQGLNYSETFLFDDITYKININYLHLPILFKHKTFVKKNKCSGFFAGSYASLKLNATRVTEIKSKSEKAKMVNVKDVDFGVVGGYSVDIVLPSGKLVFDLRSSYSLTNMMDRVDGYIPWYYGPSKEYARNVTITFSVGYLFLNIY